MQVQHVGLGTCAAPRACAARRRGRLAIGATEPLLGTRVLGPDGGDPGSGGGPSHGADDAGVDAERAQRAREPEHLALHAAGGDSEYGHDSMTRIDTSRSSTRVMPRPGRQPGTAVAVAGPVGLEQVPVLGCHPDQVLEARGRGPG